MWLAGSGSWLAIWVKWGRIGEDTVDFSGYRMGEICRILTCVQLISLQIYCYLYVYLYMYICVDIIFMAYLF